MKKTLLGLLSILIFIQSYAQNAPGKYLYTEDKIKWANPWLKTQNLSGMILNNSFLNDTVFSFNDARLSSQYNTGELKNIYEAEQTIPSKLYINSYMKLGNVYLTGNFGIHYDFGINSRWRGLVDPYKTPFVVSDSIPGNISNEIYTMSAGLSAPLGKSCAIGGKISYTASILSKHKDLRNQNTNMEFQIIPSFMYNGRHFKFGLDAGYIRNTEKVEYIQVDQSEEKYLFEFYGIWFAGSTAFSYAETSRMLINNGAVGDVQLELNFGKFRLLNNFGVHYDYGSVTETNYNNYIFGDTKTLNYSDDLTILIGNRHRIEAQAEFRNQLGYRFLQRQELDPNSNIRVWVTYGDPINCYAGNSRILSLNYTYRHAKNSFDIPWEITAGVNEMMVSQTHKEFPILFHQEFDIITPYADFTYRWRKQRNCVELTPQISYNLPISGIRNDITNHSETEINMDEPWQQLDCLDEEFDYFNSSKLGVGLTLQYLNILNSQKGMSIYANAGYKLLYSTGELMSKKSRHKIQLTIGFRF